MSVERELHTPFYIEARAAAPLDRGYNNARIGFYMQWYDDNYAALAARYKATGGRLPDPKAKDSSLSFSRAQRFMDFAKVQWDWARGVI